MSCIFGTAFKRGYASAATINIFYAFGTTFKRVYACAAAIKFFQAFCRTAFKRVYAGIATIKIFHTSREVFKRVPVSAPREIKPLNRASRQHLGQFDKIHTREVKLIKHRPFGNVVYIIHIAVNILAKTQGKGGTALSFWCLQSGKTQMGPVLCS